MPREDLPRVKPMARSVLRRMVQGDVFRVYARPSPAPPREARIRIAVCHLIPYLGDAVMVFPLIDALRKENPEAEISFFTSGSGKILGLNPAVDHLYELKRTLSWRKRLAPVDYIFDIWRWWRRDLRDLRFDVCVVLRGGVDPFHSTHLAWLLGGRERVGYSSLLEPEHKQHDLYPRPLLTKVIERIEGMHEVSRGEEVLKLAGLVTDSIDLHEPVASLVKIAHSDKGQKFVASFPVLRRPYAIVAPGASAQRKCWPSDRFGEVVTREIVARGWLPVFVGGPEIAATCDSIAASLNKGSLNLAGRTDFEELAAVCAGAKCFIGNDSGPGHVAGACGVPTLMVTAFAENSRGTHPGSPNRTGFLGPHCAIVQPMEQLAPCKDGCAAEHAHCLLQIQVDDVRKAFQDLIMRSGQVRDSHRIERVESST